jgi:hypothetical protein
MSPLPLLVEYFKFQFMQHFLFKYLPLSFSETWLTSANRQAGMDPTPLCHDDDLHITLARLTCTENHPVVSFPKVWNELPAHDLKTIGYKTLLKN